MTFNPEEIQRIAKSLSEQEIKFIKQVQNHDYPNNSPCLTRLENLDILWQEGHQDSVVVTHFGFAVMNFLNNE